MEGTLLLIQILLVGVAVAQTGQQQTFSFSDPSLQQVKQVQQVQQAPPVRQVQQVQQVRQPGGVPGQQQQPLGDVFNRALQHHAPQRTHSVANSHPLEHGNEPFRTQPTHHTQTQVFQPTPDQGRVQAFVPPPVSAEIRRPDAAQRFQLSQAQLPPMRAVAPAPPMTFQPPPIEAVPAPVQQHDAQVFSRRPPPGSPSPAIAIPVPQQHDAQVFVRQPSPAPIPSQPILQETFTQQQFLEQPQLDESVTQFQQDQQQQDFLRFQQGGQQDFQQVSRTRPVARARGAPAVPAVAARRPAPQAAPQQVASQVVRTRPTIVQVAEDGTPIDQNDENDELFREQAENAKYTFASAVDDRLTDNSQVRQETRDGLNLAGLYSYSDGFYRRTVHYEADQNGYRVTKEDVEPIGDGPQPNPMGSADVATQVAGADVRYTITADDIRDTSKQQRQQQQLLLQQQQQQSQTDFA